MTEQRLQEYKHILLDILARNEHEKCTLKTEMQTQMDTLLEYMKTGLLKVYQANMYPNTATWNPAVGCDYNCFVRTVSVVTEDKIKPISEVERGEKVFCFDGGKLVIGRVTETLRKEVDPSELIKIKFEDGQPIFCTKDHPFYSDGKWINAEDLKEGDECWFTTNEEIKPIRTRKNNPMDNPSSCKKLSKSMTGKRNPKWKPKEKVKCEVCGKTIKVSPSEAERRRFCSKECFYDFLSRKMKKENPMYDEEIAEKMGKTLREKYSREGVTHPNKGQKRPDFSEYLKKHNPSFDPERKKEIRKQMKERWRNLSEEKKQEYRERGSKVSEKLWREHREKMLKAVHKAVMRWRREKSNPEKRVTRLIEEEDLPIEYVGNGKFWIGKRGKEIHNPDFRVRGQRKVIEVSLYGRTFGGEIRDESYEEERVHFYKEHGYKCLVLWENKMENEEIIRTLREFVSNGLKVTEISKPAPSHLNRLREEGKLYVYDLRVEPHHNFFVKNKWSGSHYLLVHNCRYCIPTFQRQLKRWGKNNCQDCYHYRPHTHPERLKTSKIPSAEIIFVCGNGDITFYDPAYVRKIFPVIRRHNRNLRERYGEVTKKYYWQSKQPKTFKQYLGEFPMHSYWLTTLETTRDEGYREISHAPYPTSRFQTFLTLPVARKILTIEPYLASDPTVMVERILQLRDQGNLEYVWMGRLNKADSIDLEEISARGMVETILPLLSNGVEVRVK